MSEHMKKVNPDARQPRRGGKRLAGKEPHHAPDTARAETTGSAPTAVKPLIPEWEETPAPQAGHGEKRRRRNMREAVRSWQESEGEISPVVTGCQALAEKAKETRRHWRRLVRERRAKRFPESERLPVQLLLLAWGMLPTLGSLLGERVRTRRKQRGERVSALRAKLGRWRIHPLALLGGGCVAAAIGLFFSSYTFGTTVLYDGEEVAAVGSQSTAEEAAAQLETVTSRTLGEQYTIDASRIQYTSGLLRRQDVVDANAMKRVQAAVEEYLERFLQWNTYRESLPAQEELKQALRQRMRAYLEAGMDAEEAMELTVEKTVELIAGGLNDTLPAYAIRECAARIRQHTRA